MVGRLGLNKNDEFSMIFAAKQTKILPQLN
jgi:hypothetical protein